jgi:hypothetical protein
VGARPSCLPEGNDENDDYAEGSGAVYEFTVGVERQLILGKPRGVGYRVGSTLAGGGPLVPTLARR